MLLIWLGALGLVAAGQAIARRWRFPDAVIWCALGFGLGFVPGAEGLRLSPQTALFLLLPPLVYAAAVRLPWPAFRDNLRPIGLLGLGLVFANALVVALVARQVTGMPWALAVALGAVLSPTDPAAATAVAEGAGLPGKLVAVLEGEGLVNDAVALTILRIAAAAVVTGRFSIGSGALRFLAIVVGEPLYGWLVGFLAMKLRACIRDPRVEITVSLLTPFAAYLLPEHLGGSGILATVAAGMYVGERMPDLVPAGTRLHAASVWDILVFLLNGVLFLMAGVELRRVIADEAAPVRVFEWGLAVTAALIAARASWCALMWGIFRGREMLREEDGRPMPAGHMGVVAWAGMRGPISLAAALSIPIMGAATRTGDLETVLFITAVVIAVTLVAQGIALPRLVRWLGVSEDADRDRSEERRQLAVAEAEAARAAIARLSELQSDGRVAGPTAERLRRYYGDRLSEASDGEESQRVLLLLIEAERDCIRRLRGERRVNDRVAGELERTLDLRQSTVRSGDTAG